MSNCVIERTIEQASSGLKRKKNNASCSHRPFRCLKALLKTRSLPLASFPRIISVNKIDLDPDDPEYEDKLFLRAMADVVPLAKGNYIRIDPESKPPKQQGHQSTCESKADGRADSESLLRLKKLVEKGEGFVIAHTPEYIEGRVYCDNPEITKRLHRGDFSIQAHIDLHGLGVEAAQRALDRFLKETLLAGKRAVLVIHGRGLSSPHQPVLKNKVQDWLTRGPWRKWIIAFTSARSYDGGTGATYILLRQRPYTKRMRKKFAPQKHKGLPATNPK